MARAVARRLGVSIRTLDRWIASPHLSFPAPSMITHDSIGRVANRFWRLGAIVEWQSDPSRQLPHPGRPKKVEAGAEAAA